MQPFLTRFEKNRRFSMYSISSLVVGVSLVVQVFPTAAQEKAARGAPSDAEELTLYVSTVGNDTWSGRLGEPNADGTDGPLASVQKARDIIRETKAATGGLTKPVTVMLRGGVYPQAEPIVFTPADSGTRRVPLPTRRIRARSRSSVAAT